MKQDEFARRVVERLNQRLDALPATITSRLARTRSQALERKPVHRSLRIGLADWAAGHRIMLRVAVPALFVLIAASTIFFKQAAPEHDPFDVETALIGDELPIHAYTDPGFATWLQHSSHEKQQ